MTSAHDSAAIAQTNADIGMRSKHGIPIRNLWVLLLYASDYYREQHHEFVGIEERPDEIVDLVAEVLCRRVEERLGEGLQFGYAREEAVLRRVRGRVDLLKTERHHLLYRGQVACRYDTFTTDIVRNRYVRAALESLVSLVQSKVLARRARRLAATFYRMGVTGPKPTRREISGVRFGRHDARDRDMVSAARLVFDLGIPTQFKGRHTFASLAREEEKLRALYEKAVAGFYATVLPSEGWSVRAGRQLRWQAEQKSAGIDDILPNMYTDVVLTQTATGRCIVIDTKFTSILKSGHYRSRTLESGHIYQMYAYLRSEEDAPNSPYAHATGILLHPSVGEDVHEHAVIQGHRMAFMTVDLAAPATELRRQLLVVVEER